MAWVKRLARSTIACAIGLVMSMSFSHAASVATMPALLRMAGQSDIPAPIAQPLSVTVNHDAPTQITLLATDPNDPQTFTFAIQATPTHGQLSAVNGNSVVYMPTSGYAGSDSFTYTVTTRNGESLAATVSITVLAAAAPPPTSVVSLPTLDIWAMLALAVLIGLASVRRKRKN
jgi:Bacterial Ig domain